MRQPLENPFYYLDNFQQVLRWVGEHHGDLLLAPEQRFLEDFPVLPQASRALLVRMVMRKGELFRTGKLRYARSAVHGAPPHRWPNSAGSTRLRR